MKNVEFFFDYTCPYAYLASTQIEGVCTRGGANLTWKPMLLGGVFRALDVPQVLFKTLSPAKAKHNFADMHRWADLWDVPLIMPAEHPRRSVEALRATLATPEEKQRDVIHAIYKAYWVDGLDIADRDVLADILEACGVDKNLAGPFDDEIKGALRSSTDDAIERGTFGAPATFLDGELYWGQDRLWMVEKALGQEPWWPPVPENSNPVPEVEFYFDVSSPFAYLASTQIERVCAQYGAKLLWKPMFLGGVFKLLEGPIVPLQTFNAPKQRFVAQDVLRWANHWKIPYSWPSTFPMITAKAMRMILSMGQEAGPLVHALYKAYWADDRNINDPEVLTAILRRRIALLCVGSRGRP